jgi:RNA polymerase sigma factor (TIGR02999 family)
VATYGVQRQVRSTLAELVSGEATANERLFLIVYDDLRALAASLLKMERREHTLQPTALVHEAWIRLVGVGEASWPGVAHFKAVAVRAMRRVLVDHARRRRSDKRGGDLRRVSLSGVGLTVAEDVIDMLALDDALQRLESLNERQARVVELRFLGGLTVTETAHVLAIDPSTVKADWAMARVFLADELGGAGHVKSGLQGDGDRDP